jgi:hypothetical protein
MNKTVIILLTICLSFVYAAPQNSPVAVNAQKYSPFNYQYKVEDAEQKLYHDKTESGDESGKVSEIEFDPINECSREVYLFNFEGCWQVFSAFT